MFFPDLGDVDLYAASAWYGYLAGLLLRISVSGSSVIGVSLSWIDVGVMHG